MAEKFDRRVLFDYLQEKYGITKLPKHFFMKMSNIFSGKLDGLSRPIPPEHMYDMWVRKSSYLGKIHERNKSQGKKMDAYVMLNYDLAVIMGKYDDYLAWLDKQKSLSTSNENLKENVTVTEVLYKKNTQSNVNIKINKNDDFADILDDLI